MEKTAEVYVVIGLKWGDEGKGKVVDALTQNCDVIERFQGGANAGHTVSNHRGEFALHTIPSGIFDPDKTVIIGSLVSFAPNKVSAEIRELESKGVAATKLAISDRAILNLPVYGPIDNCREERRGANRIGTTGQGIGPSYADRSSRDGLRVGALNQRDRFFKYLETFLADKRLSYPELSQSEAFNIDYYLTEYPKWMEVFDGKIQDTHPLTQRLLAEGARFLLEGAQGALLDNDWGSWPDVTSSNITVASAYHASGIPLKYHKVSLAIAKAYDSRVGSGGMPTELQNQQGELIRQKGKEFGTTTGRPRRVGYFDAVAGRFAQELNQFDYLVVNSLDVLAGLGPMRICVGYDKAGQKVADFPSEDDLLRLCSPLYYPEDFVIEDDFSQVTRFEDLSPQAQEYLHVISNKVGIPLALVGKGRSREDLLKVNGFSLG